MYSIWTHRKEEWGWLKYSNLSVVYKKSHPESLDRDKTGLGWGHLNTFGDYLTLVLF